MQLCKTPTINLIFYKMNSNKETNQFGPGSKIDNKKKQNSHENDDDFLSGDNKSRPYPNKDLDEGYAKPYSSGIGTPKNDEENYEMSPEDEDRYNNGNSEHDDLIEDSKPRYSSPSRNGSHRNH
jgi:hypothetical protein